jgi:hypothetical protein
MIDACLHGDIMQDHAKLPVQLPAQPVEEPHMSELETMSLPELEAYLQRLRDDLEDVEEERMFVLGQTGLHVSATEVKKFETTVQGLREKIAEVETAIDSRRNQK